MAGRIADGEEYGFVLFFGQFKGLGAPGIPVDRVMGVLKEIWTTFINETISMFGGACYCGHAFFSGWGTGYYDYESRDNNNAENFNTNLFCHFEESLKGAKISRARAKYGRRKHRASVFHN